MTSAGSQRNLAAFLGVSHQKVGRWLREGEEGGAREIPREAAHAINQLFHIHAEVAREQAHADKVKFNPKAPVYLQRLPLRTGQPGQRVIAQNTEFIRSDLREKVITEAQATGQFYGVAIRSTIELARYNKQAQERAKGHRRSESQHRAAKELKATLTEGKHILPIYTRAEGIGRNTDGERAARGINKMLRQKHEPATGEKGTHLADMFLFQLTTPPPAKPTPPNDSQGKAKSSPGKLARRAAKAMGKFRK